MRSYRFSPVSLALALSFGHFLPVFTAPLDTGYSLEGSQQLHARDPKDAVIYFKAEWPKLKKGTHCNDLQEKIEEALKVLFEGPGHRDILEHNFGFPRDYDPVYYGSITHDSGTKVIDPEEPIKIIVSVTPDPDGTWDEEEKFYSSRAHVDKSCDVKVDAAFDPTHTQF